MWVKKMRRNEDVVVLCLRSSEETAKILDRVVFLDARTDERPGDAFFAQDIVLRIDDHQSGVVLAESHVKFLSGYKDLMAYRCCADDILSLPITLHHGAVVRRHHRVELRELGGV